MTQLGVFDLFRLGVGPSSSHTVGPMRAGKAFATHLEEGKQVAQSIKIDLYGSLAATGVGHGTDRAVLLGLCGATPETVPISEVENVIQNIESTGELLLQGGNRVKFDLDCDLIFHAQETLDFHTNALTIRAEFGERGHLERTYYSTGGGFVLEQIEENPPTSLLDKSQTTEREDVFCLFPFKTGSELLTQCVKTGKSVAQIVWENEKTKHGENKTRNYLNQILNTMFEAVEAGVQTEGVLPGGLGVPRRARQLCKKLQQTCYDPMVILDWVNLYAIAVNEENAAGHRIVTAPTNGAAGVVPAVLGYFLISEASELVGGLDALAATVPLWELKKCLKMHPDLRKSAHQFLLVAAAIGSLIKTNASLAGAEVGCQGEVGSASAMAAAGLTQAMGGTPQQVENAAEIAMEHSLGLTCDPVGGLVQIPCIERNAIGAVKAISAARIALYGDGRHQVSLDVAIETMLQTGLDMHSKYKETSVGGLAVNIVEC